MRNSGTFHLLDGLQYFLDTFVAMQAHLHFHQLSAIQIKIRIASEMEPTIMKKEGKIMLSQTNTLIYAYRKSYDRLGYLHYPF